jgi:ferredoxin
MTPFRVSVEGCEGHGLCYAKCPNVFQPDESGYTTVVVDEIPDAELANARAAEANCPERAIHIEAS